jgi:hypothetical protein
MSVTFSNGYTLTFGNYRHNNNEKQLVFGCTTSADPSMIKKLANVSGHYVFIWMVEVSIASSKDVCHQSKEPVFGHPADEELQRICNTILLLLLLLLLHPPGNHKFQADAILNCERGKNS